MRDEYAAKFNLRLMWRPLVFILLMLVLWEVGVRRQPSHLLPGPWACCRAASSISCGTGCC